MTRTISKRIANKLVDSLKDLVLKFIKKLLDHLFETDYNLSPIFPQMTAFKDAILYHKTGKFWVCGISLVTSFFSSWSDKISMLQLISTYNFAKSVCIYTLMRIPQKMKTNLVLMNFLWLCRKFTFTRLLTVWRFLHIWY